jgi:rSAM/selenodomain-associated transferase 1
MAKAPRPGHVKTRLLKHAAEDAVVGLYRCLVEDTLAMTGAVPDLHVAVVCPVGDGADLTAWLHGVAVVEQNGDGLADALTSSFVHFSAAGFRRIVAFNCDTPHLPPRILEGAFDALLTADVVAGPTEDGGYYLVGARAPHPTLFDKTNIGTANALDALIARARDLDLRVAQTDPWYDIDVNADVEQLAVDLAMHPERAPKTAAFLAHRHVR